MAASFIGSTTSDLMTEPKQDFPFQFLGCYTITKQLVGQYDS